MDRTQFQALLRETGCYETDPDAPARWTDRLLGRSDTWYYLRTLVVVMAANAKARRGRYGPEALADSSFDILKLAEGCGGRFRIAGALNMTAGGPFVVMANHMSMFETFLLPVLLLTFGDMVTVVKESLLRYALFGPVVRAQQPIPVTRQDPRRDLKTVLEGGLEQLRRGRTVLLFPQATRTPVLRPASMNSLAAKVAQRAGVPLVPLALKTDFHGIGKVVREVGKLDRRQTIHFTFGEPLRVEGNGRQAHARAVRFIVDRFREWGGVVDDRDGNVA